jgi:hypothetical protein
MNIFNEALRLTGDFHLFVFGKSAVVARRDSISTWSRPRRPIARGLKWKTKSRTQ